MMKIKVSEAQGLALNWLVAKCQGADNLQSDGIRHYFRMNNAPRILGGGASIGYAPSTNWSQGGPIIDRELLQVNPHFLSAGYETPEGLWEWEAYVLGPSNIDGNFEQHGPTALIAAMRCYVASKLGEEVEVPDELMKG